MGKSKRMTQQEKKLRAAAKRELQESGLLPPDKKRPNYKKFCKEAHDAWLEWDNYRDMIYIGYAITIMLADINPSKETVGVAKVIKIAQAYKDFVDEKAAAGETRFSLKELFDQLEPIQKA